MAGPGATEILTSKSPLVLQARSLSQVGFFDVCLSSAFRMILLLFPGSAVYIFGIDQRSSQPDIAFTVGSIQQTHHYTGSGQFAYDALFFSATGLASDETHTVNWVFNFADTGPPLQVALFDYAIVTSGKEDITTTNAVATRYVFLIYPVPESEFYPGQLQQRELRNLGIHV